MHIFVQLRERTLGILSDLSLICHVVYDVVTSRPTLFCGRFNTYQTNRSVDVTCNFFPVWIIMNTF